MGRYNTYTYAQEQFLIRHSKGVSRKILTDMFNAEFGTNKSVLAIKSWCNNRCLYNGNDGRFKNGNVSWQTGLSGDEYKKHFSDESFQRSIAGIKPKRIHNIGDTVYKSGEIWVIVNLEPNAPFEKRAMLKRRYVYEQAYGKIPPSHRIIQLDGDKMNFKLDNLYCIPSKFIPTINKNHWLTDSREHTLAAIKWCELFYAMKESKQALKGGAE